MNNGMNTMMLAVGNCCEVEGVESHRMIIDAFLFEYVSNKLEQIQYDEEERRISLQNLLHHEKRSMMCIVC